MMTGKESKISLAQPGADPVASGRRCVPILKQKLEQAGHGPAWLHFSDGESCQTTQTTPFTPHPSLPYTLNTCPRLISWTSPRKRCLTLQIEPVLRVKAYWIKPVNHPPSRRILYYWLGVGDDQNDSKETFTSSQYSVASRFYCDLCFYCFRSSSSYRISMHRLSSYIEGAQGKLYERDGTRHPSPPLTDYDNFCS